MEGLREGRENCLKYLKRGSNRKEAGGTNISKRGARCVKWWVPQKGSWNSLMNYGYYICHKPNITKLI